MREKGKGKRTEEDAVQREDAPRCSYDGCSANDNASWLQRGRRKLQVRIRTKERQGEGERERDKADGRAEEAEGG